MKKRLWKNAKAIWDETSSPSNSGWVIRVDEINGDEITPMYYAPAPDVYYKGKNADKNEIIQETAKWENARLVD